MEALREAQFAAHQLARHTGHPRECSQDQCRGWLALAATPKKSAKEGKGEVDVPLKVLGVEVLPGSFLLADEDGLLLLPEPPSGVRSGG